MHAWRMIPFLASLLALAWLSAPLARAQTQWERAGAAQTATWDVRALVSDQAGTIYAGTTGGVERSPDGNLWEPFNNGLNSYSITRMVLTPDNKTLFITTSGNAEVYRYLLDAGQAWERVSGSFYQGSPITGLAADANGRVFAANGGLTQSDNYGYLYRSEDSGSSWTVLKAEYLHFLAHLYVMPSGVLIADRLQIDDLTLRFSIDCGQTWLEQIPGSKPGYYPNSWPMHGLPASFGVNPHSGSVFIGLSNYTGETSNLLRLPDQETYWQPLPRVGSGIEDPHFGSISRTVTAIASRPSGDMFVGVAGEGVWRSIDDGQTWTDVSLGLENKNVQALIAAPDGTLYAGTAAGLFRSTALVPVRLAAFAAE